LQQFTELNPLFRKGILSDAIANGLPNPLQYHLLRIKLATSAAELVFFNGLTIPTAQQSSPYTR
jgi:hypothetical protein